jgi:hypothetical protein
LTSITTLKSEDSNYQSAHLNYYNETLAFDNLLANSGHRHWSISDFATSTSLAIHLQKWERHDEPLSINTRSSHIFSFKINNGCAIHHQCKSELFQNPETFPKFDFLPWSLPSMAILTQDDNQIGVGIKQHPEGTYFDELSSLEIVKIWGP